MFSSPQRINSQILGRLTAITLSSAAMTCIPGPLWRIAVAAAFLQLCLFVQADTLEDGLSFGHKGR